MKLTLYYAPVACSLVPFVTLAEAGAEFDVRVISLRDGEQMSDEFRRINPKHKVPLLVIDDQPLSENVAIQMWIAKAFPAAKLLPADDWEYMQAVSKLSWFASGVHPHLSRINKPSAFCETPGSADSICDLAAKNLAENFQIADELLTDRTFFQSHFTAVDAYFFWCFRRAKLLKLDVSNYANCEAHFDRMMARDSVKRVLDFEAKALAA